MIVVVCVCISLSLSIYMYIYIYIYIYMCVYIYIHTYKCIAGELRAARPRDPRVAERPGGRAVRPAPVAG